MQLRTTTLALLLSTTALLALVPQPTSASIPPPCERIDCTPTVPCTSITMGVWDPLHQPTNVSCYIPLCELCVCQWVSAGPDAQAAGQDFTGTTYVGCGIGIYGTFTPGPVDTTAPICVSFHGDGSPAVKAILDTLFIQPVCANTDCTFPPTGVGGVVGQAIAFVEAVATIWCHAAQQTVGTVTDAAIATCDATTQLLTGRACPV